MTPELTEEDLDNFSIQSFDLEEDIPSLFAWDKMTDSTLGVEDQIKQFFEFNDRIPTIKDDKALNCNDDFNLVNVTVSQRDNASDTKVRRKKNNKQNCQKVRGKLIYIYIHRQHLMQFTYLTHIPPFKRQEDQI